MRLRTALCIATLFLVCFTVAAWPTPVPKELGATNAGPDNPSLSGKISRISDAAFSLEIVQNQEHKTVEFLVDEDTKVEGRLKVGSKATVEYRANQGNYVAVHVVVTPSSGRPR